ncbi:ATP-binding cassette domain-containing protein [Thiotrichales bacterium 19S3-7]|nr:ATP-binding cassette domain-containing protein [Thiotrichales bacterium 19S3-7]MCF6801635.1 ATP-binding cassette domain-containing protein [Thiotrichales bacterium 19S3-11]
MALVSFDKVSLNYADQILLDQISFTINHNERICIIGRNGAGKSSLLKLVQGILKPDNGQIIYQQNLKIHTLEQEVPQSTTGSIFDVVLAGLGEIAKILLDYETLIKQPQLNEADYQTLLALQEAIEANNAWDLTHRVEKILSKLNLDGQLTFSALSGGLKRRVLLAKALVSQPDLLLLDEPTNHLDIESIQWLEEFLNDYEGSILFISHDRVFLDKLARRILELDRGHLIDFSGNYEQFITHKEHLLDIEQTHNALFDKKLQQEEKWIRQGIKARRTRNEGRVRALEAMRQKRSQRRQLQGHTKLTQAQSERSGKSVIVADNISFQYNNNHLFKNFSIEIQRGDKIGILGPNGCGKSTLINVLLENLQPSEGSVSLGSNLEIAYFDQLRNQLNEQLSIIDNIAQGSEYIELNNKKKHVLSYLSDFLFTPVRARTPVKALSGGEKNRALLAKVLSKPNNFLILDEPTNDLDIETLEILEMMLVDYPGTLILVSHDRKFINHIVTSSIVFEGDGIIEEYIGGYDDWLRQRKSPQKIQNQTKNTNPIQKKLNKQPQKLSYQQKKQLETLPSEIEAIEAKIQKITETLSEPSFYQNDPQLIKDTQLNLTELQTQLEKLYHTWAELEALKD